MNLKTLSLLYTAFIASGFIFAYIYGESTKKFLWREYIALIATPLIGVAVIILLLGTKPLYIFLIACVAMPVLEWLVGFFYHKVLGRRLWFYERYPLPGNYTSYLAIPFWGAGIVLLWLLLASF